MGKTKSMGTEYQIVARGTWEQVAESVRATKVAIESPTQGHFFSTRDFELENRILKAYLVPQEGESFEDYKGRFVQIFVGEGVKGKLAK